MDFERLKEFLDLAETLSFTKSSRNLNVSQSALSRHIAELEREVGAELLSRSTTSVSLTPAGRVFYERAVVTVRDYTNLLAAPGDAPAARKATLHVSGNTVQVLPNRLLYGMALRASAQGLPLRFDYHKTRSLANVPPVPAALDMLKSGETDLIVDVLPFDAPNPDGTDGIRICYERLLAIGPSAGPFADRKGMKLDDLRGCTPVALAVYRSCPAIELAPFVAAGIDTARAKTVFVQNMLEIPETLGTMEPNEVALLEEGFYRSHLEGQEPPGSCAVLDVSDDRLRFAYWLLWKEGDARTSIRQAADLARALVDDARHTHPELVHPDGTLWVEAL